MNKEILLIILISTVVFFFAIYVFIQLTGSEYREVLINIILFMVSIIVLTIIFLKCGKNEERNKGNNKSDSH